MLGFLAGVPGRLKTLTDRLTATWAAKLDALHALWTATLAARIDTNIASRATPADVTAAVAGLAAIKSVQQGIASGTTGASTSISINKTITAVDPAKCIVIFNGANLPSGQAFTGDGGLYLANSTTLTYQVTRGGTANTTVYFYYTVVEFF